MSAANDPQVSAGSGRAFLRWPGRGAADRLGRHRGPDDGFRGRRPRHCAVAAGVAVAVVLCWVHTSRVLPGPAVRSGRAIQATARIRPAGEGKSDEGCAGERSRLQGTDWWRLAPGDRRQQSVRVFLAAYVRSRQSASDSPGLGQIAERTAGIRVLGWRGIIVAPGIGCRPAGRWLGAGYQVMSYRLPSGPARYRFGVLAFNGRVAWGPGRSRRGGCAAGEVADRVPLLDAAFPDRGTSRLARLAHADPGSRLAVAGDQLHQAPGEGPALICVMIQPNRRGAGMSTREQWCGAYGGSGGQMGSGDRASLPGRSSRYRVIVLVCPRCGTTMQCLFCDEGDMPLCEHSAHGQMEVQQ